jgi:hypothetical protein
VARSDVIIVDDALVEVYRQRKPVGSGDDQYVFQRDGEPLEDRAVLKDVIRPLAKQLGFYFEGFGCLALISPSESDSDSGGRCLSV